ncbi:MAG: ABC transporter permease [Bacilli bacterium]|nr:ABC transporter permease [Bacilli bacterium]
MLKYIIKRLIFAVLNVIIVLSIIYLLSQYIFVSQIMRKTPFINRISIVWNMYKNYVQGIITDWDWGRSRIAYGNVWYAVVPKVKLTFIINIIAFAVYTLIGITLGIITAFYRNRPIDYLVSNVSLLFNSLPSFILIFLLILVLGYTFKIFPPLHMSKSYGYKIYYRSYVIPMLALVLPQIGYICQLVRGEVIEIMNADYMLLARLKGLNKFQSLMRHGFKNVLVNILPALSTTFFGVITSSMFIERVSNIPGLALLFFEALIDERPDGFYLVTDTPLLIVVCGFYCVLIFGVNFIIDVIYRALDPTMEVGS